MVLAGRVGQARGVWWLRLRALLLIAAGGNERGHLGSYRQAASGGLICLSQDALGAGYSQPGLKELLENTEH